jgi:kanamycin kinase
VKTLRLGLREGMLPAQQKRKESERLSDSDVEPARAEVNVAGETAWLAVPPGLKAAYTAFEWNVAYQYAQHSLVYRLSRDGSAPLFLKLAEAGHYPALSDEAERMRWARTYLPVPEVVDQGSEHSVTWLVTTGLPGQDGTHPDQLGRPAELARVLARGLRRFHDGAPVHSCPFDFRLGAALEHVRRRLSSGLIDSARDFHPEFEHLTPDAAVELLESTRPDSEDVVVCHGDYCPPNILIEGEQATGYVDLGELGVADRWWDLAAATWSITWNLGLGYEEVFLAEYGAEPDPHRLAFYRLLYDLAC